MPAKYKKLLINLTFKNSKRFRMIKYNHKTNNNRHQSNRFKLFKIINLVYKIEEILIKISLVITRICIIMKYIHLLKKINRLIKNSFLRIKNKM